MKLIERDIQKRLDAANQEINTIKNSQEKRHQNLLAQFRRIKFKVSSKIDELNRLLNEAKDKNLREIRDVENIVKKNYSKHLQSIVKNLNNKNEQNLQLERNKLVEAEKS